MSLLRKGRRTQVTGESAAPPQVLLDARAAFASCFLAGEGIEIGALHLPLPVPNARVRYVDRMPAEALREEYPELAEWELVPVDVIDDGEQLTTVPERSLDFIIANHFLEHCEDPIGTIGVHLGKLRPGGVLFYAVPDKRYTFDFNRPITPLEHMVRDHEEGPEVSRAGHFEDWARSVEDAAAPESRLHERAAHARESGYSIHMHVWTQAEFLQMVLHCRERFEDRFDIEAMARQGIELVTVLRKHGDLPAATPASSGERPANDLEAIELRRQNQRLQSELQRVTSSASWRVTRPLRGAKQWLHERGVLREPD